MTDIKLQQGDYVCVGNLTSPQVKELMDKFVEAGARDFDQGLYMQKDYPFLQWCKDNDVWCGSTRPTNGRELTPKQVLASGEHQTPCEKLGYKVGDRFEVLEGVASAFEEGSIIVLQKDDDSGLPLFKLESGDCQYKAALCENGGMVAGSYEYLSNVKKLEPGLDYFGTEERPHYVFEADRFNVVDPRDPVKRPVAHAHDILKAGVEHMKDRATTYDAPGGERSMVKTVAMFNVLHGTSMTEEEGWRFMALLKMVRSEQGEFKLDNYED